jgi:hypothetical protein
MDAMDAHTIPHIQFKKSLILFGTQFRKPADGSNCIIPHAPYLFHEPNMKA